MKKMIYCPECLKKGKKKRLAVVKDDTRGTIYLWCKECRKEIKIELK